MAPNVFMYELCLPLPYKCFTISMACITKSKCVPKSNSCWCPTPRLPVTENRINKATKNKNLGASGAALAAVDIKCSGRFARAPSPVPPGHQPPPVPLVPGTAHTARPHTCPCGVSCERQPLAGSRARWRWGRRGSGGGPGRRGRTCRPCRTA
uniref:HYD1 n=1 Tax=Arundo donax TaxID=35708 RepID=A0A0A9AML7_ARUDO